MSDTATSTVIYQHADHPEWGRGVVLPTKGREDRLDLAFETGGRRIIMKSFAQKLQPVEMSPEEAALLGTKLATRRPEVTGTIKLPAKKKSRQPSVSLGTFDAQVKLFLGLYPGGFRGEKFERDERGGTAGKKKKGDKSVALALAAEAFTPAAFDARAFEAALELAKTAGLVHPLDGATALAGLKDDQKPPFLAALKDLLHGSDAFPQRFERFVAALRFGDETKRPSWPMATMFAALTKPAEHVCVKPTFFQKQAVLMDLPLEYDPTPSAAIYEQCVAIARATEAALRKAGQDPRDLLDVSTFISVTHGAKEPAAAKAVAQG